MNRIALVIITVAFAGGALAGCSDPKKRPVGDTCGGDGDCIDGLCLSGMCLDPEADDDGDGLINRVEGALGSNPLNPDSDYDGVPDGQEVNGVDARDTDGDGKSDVLESIVVDADQDCLPDELDPDNGTSATDLSPAVPALCSHVGVCGTSIGNVRLECDENKHPHCIYTDIPTYEAEEATCDGLDNDCDGRADEGFRDSDGDGIADCADSDVDGDGAVQASDNCPLIANDGQENADGDGLGDACDPPSAPGSATLSPVGPSNDLTPTAAGTGEALSIVRIYTDAACTTKVGEGAASAGGAYSFDLTLTGSGEIHLYAQATNSAGLVSECVAAGSYVIDVAAPAGPAGVLARAEKWTETSATFTFTGVTEPFAHVAIYDNASCDGEPLATVADEAGAFRASADYENTVGATGIEVTDIAGNTSTCFAGPTLFGDVSVNATQGDLPLVGLDVQFHYPDGTPLAWVTTGDDGTVKQLVFAGCALTAAVEYNEGFVHFVTVKDLQPGQVVPFARPFGTIAVDRTDYVNFTWPAMPEGTYFLTFTTPCGSYNYYVQGGETTTSYNYYGGCLGDTFAATVTAFDTNYLPTGFGTTLGNVASSNPDQPTQVDFKDAWRTDFEQFTVRFDNLAQPSPLDVSAIQYLDDHAFAYSYGSDFGAGATDVTAPFVKLAGVKYDFIATVAHLALNGNYGTRGVVAHDVGASNVVDVAALPPRLLDGGLLYQQTGVESWAYTGWQWDSEPNVARSAQAGLAEGSMYGPNGTVRWQLVMAPSDDEGGSAPFPQLDADFPGSWMVNNPYYAYDDNVTFYDFATGGYADFIAGCATDIVACFNPATKSTFTSCCSNNNRD